MNNHDTNTSIISLFYIHNSNDICNNKMSTHIYLVAMTIKLLLLYSIDLQFLMLINFALFLLF